MKFVDIFQKYVNHLRKRLLNSDEHRRIIHLYTYALLSLVSLVMTIINIYTKEVPLGISTGIFAVLCALFYFIQKKLNKIGKVTQLIFGASFLALLLFFVVFGYPGGFSILWICLVPPISMLFYGVKGGSILSGICLLILVFFLWVPFGQKLISSEAIYSFAHSQVCSSDVKYSAIFRLRFPFLFMADYAIAFILETIKSMAFREISRINDENEYLSQHDYLTNLYNRTGFRKILVSKQKDLQYKTVCVMICDVDNLKLINDKYGHLVGDAVLRDFGSILQSKLGDLVCRYGGDEFCFVAYDDNDALNKLSNLVEEVRNYVFKHNEVELQTTITIGAYLTNKNDFEDSDNCLKKADDNLYIAKTRGKNQVVATSNLNVSK